MSINYDPLQSVGRLKNLFESKPLAVQKKVEIDPVVTVSLQKFEERKTGGIINAKPREVVANKIVHIPIVKTSVIKVEPIEPEVKNDVAKEKGPAPEDPQLEKGKQVVMFTVLAKDLNEEAVPKRLSAKHKTKKDEKVDKKAKKTYFQEGKIDERKIIDIEFFIKILFETAVQPSELSPRIGLKEENVKIIIESHSWFVHTEEFLQVIRNKSVTFNETQTLLILEFITRLSRSQLQQLSPYSKNLISEIVESLTKKSDSLNLKLFRNITQFDTIRDRCRNKPFFDQPPLKTYADIKQQIINGKESEEDRKFIAEDLFNHFTRLFKGLNRSDFANAQWKDVEKYRAVEEITSFNDKLTNFVAKEIFSQEKTSKRARLSRFYMKLALKAKKQHNFQMMIAVLNGVLHTDLNRDRDLQALIESKHPKTFAKVQALYGKTTDYLNNGKQEKKIRSALKKKQPCMPYLGTFLNAFNQLHENKNVKRYTPENLPNLEKMKIISLIQNTITDCQNSLSNPSKKHNTDIQSLVESTDRVFIDRLSTCVISPRPKSEGQTTSR